VIMKASRRSLGALVKRPSRSQTSSSAERRRLGQEFIPGDETWYASDSPTSSFSGIFEDDGQTGYFYAYDRSQEASPILDAVHIYDVRNVRDREIPSVVEIIWSADRLRSRCRVVPSPS
jgi:hypothetical protein